MHKLGALTLFLLNLDLFAAENMESFVDDLTVIPAGRPGTAGQIVVCEMDYTAVFYIERYPHQANPAEILIAQISAWLLQNDQDRTAGYNFPVTVDVLDASTADLELRIPFHEIVTASAQTGGELTFNNLAYSIDA